MRVAQKQGLIASSHPVKPQISLEGRLASHWGSLLIGGLLIFGLARFIGNTRRRHKRARILNGMQNQARSFVHSLCVAATCDGYVDEDEINTITAIASRATGQDVTRKQVLAVLQQTRGDLTEKEYRLLRKNLTPVQRVMLLNGVLEVVAADQKLDPMEEKFVGKLCTALELSREQFQASWQRAVA